MGIMLLQVILAILSIQFVIILFYHFAVKFVLKVCTFDFQNDENGYYVIITDCFGNIAECSEDYFVIVVSSESSFGNQSNLVSLIFFPLRHLSFVDFLPAMLLYQS